MPVALQYRYMEAAALVQLIEMAEQLRGLRGRDLKRRREFWESRLRGRLTVSARRLAFAPWLPSKCGASRKMLQPEVWLVDWATRVSPTDLRQAVSTEQRVYLRALPATDHLRWVPSPV